MNYIGPKNHTPRYFSSKRGKFGRLDSQRVLKLKSADGPLKCTYHSCIHFETDFLSFACLVENVTRKIDLVFYFHKKILQDPIFTEHGDSQKF